MTKSDMQPRRHKRILTPPPSRRGTGHVYFLRCQGFIKIGSASNAHARHRAIQTVTPFEVTLLCAIPGDEKQERSLHRKFSHLRERGEWFRSAPELEEFIAERLEETKAANLKDWLSVATCEGCGKDTLCKIRRPDVEAAVTPMLFVKEHSCVPCVLKDADLYMAKTLENYYGYAVRARPT